MRDVRWNVLTVPMLTVALVLAGCGDDTADTTSETPSDAAPDGNDLASLAVIDTRVDVNDAEGTEGDPLAVGATVSTNSDGFGEVNYFDGSITRVAQDAEFTLTALSDDEGDRRVEASLDTGTSWNRVERLSQTDGAFSIDTPVASATATGTAFSVDCTNAPESCEFTVVEGTIELELPDGSTIELAASQSLTITAQEEPPEPVELTRDELADDAWITTNIDLDEQAGLDPIPLTDDGDGAGDEEGAAIARAWTIERDVEGVLAPALDCIPFEVAAQRLGDDISRIDEPGPNPHSEMLGQFVRQAAAQDCGVVSTISLGGIGEFEQCAELWVCFTRP